MSRYIIRRLLLMVPLLILVTFAVASMMRLVGGDPASIVLGETATAADRAKFKEHYHLDEPLPVQYVLWWNDVAHGNLGTSVVQKTTVTDELQHRLPITVELLVFAIIFTAIIGISLGVISAFRQNSPVDYGIRMLSIFGLSIPSFWLATLFILLPAIWWGYLPPLSRTPITSDPLQNLRQYVVPGFTLSVGASAIVMRLTRSSLLEVLRHDYIRTARAKGVSQRMILYRHALKNALIPVITVLGLQVAGLMGGSVIIEQIFNLQGIGSFLVSSILFRDYPSVQGLVLFFAITVMMVNLAIDTSYAFLDPRIRLS